MKNFFKPQSIKEDKLLRKFLLAFVMMSLIPFLLLVYIVYYIVIPKTELGMTQIRWLIFWIGCSSLVGFWMGRSIINTFLSIIRNIKSVSEGDLSVRIKTKDESEINELARSFNRITAQLEENIANLEKQKRLLQEVLSRVGEAVASFQNIDKFLDLIIMTTIDAAGAANGKLMLLDREKQELYTKVSFGTDLSIPERINIGEGAVGFVAKEGKPFLVSASANEGKASISLPLIYSNRIIGVLYLSEKKNKEDFSQDDMVLLKDLSSQIAIAFENYRLSQDAERTYVETITALAMAVEARDQYTRGHTKRVGEYCTRLAKEFNLDSKTIQLLNDASNLHDIGKIGVPDEVLRKILPLNEQEERFFQEHAGIGEKILKPIHSLANLSYLVGHHHEQLDGKGYPDGLKGEEISLPLHIMIVADAFDAMTSDRPYRKAMSIEDAKQELLKYSGIRYDREVVEKFIKLI